MKKIYLCLFTLILSFIGIVSVYAGSLYINGDDSVYVGSTVSVTVNFNNIAGRFKIQSSNSSVLSGNYEDFYDNQSVKFLFTANGAGEATITVTPVGAVGDYDDDVYSGGGRSLTVSVIKKNTPSNIDINVSYSKNNYLSGLSIEGYDLNPSFDKETLEYKVELKPGIDKINVSATPEDSRSTVRGAGEVSVSEGLNTITITVFAQNGNERTYTVLANLEEKDPIIVKIKGKEYRVIKKSELIEERTGYVKKTVKIDDFDIPCLYNEVTKVKLVGLKDSEGNITYYSYNSKTGEYSSYKEFSFDAMNLYVHESENSKYDKVNIKINDKDVTAYKIDGADDYYLLFATNISNGFEGYYLYDAKENSIQRYNTFMLDKLTQEKDKYLSLVLVLSSVCFLTMLFLLIQVNRENKREI